MSYKYHVNFGQNLLVGTSSIIKKKRQEEDKCHEFSLKETTLESSPVELVPGKTATREVLFGPASLIKCRKVIYPCTRNKCVLPCPCSICKNQPSLLLISHQELNCSCSDCYAQFEDHSSYHATFHTSCKFCSNMMQTIPFFNFYFVKYEERVIVHGECNTYYNRVAEWSPSKTCQYRTSHNEDLAVQIAKQEVGKPKCEECHTIFKSSEDFKRHINNYHLTGKKFVHQYRLVRMKNKVYKITMFKCDACEEEFTAKRNLKRHVESDHFLESHDCQDCGKHFSRRDALKRHIEAVHSRTSEVFKCDLCEATFNRENNYQRHKLSFFANDGSVRNKCTWCFKDFCTEKLLRNHLREKHNYQDFSCEFCSRDFNQKSTFQMHMATRKVVECTECDESFCNKK